MMMVENTGAPLADLAGTNPSTGTARYYFGDNLGSTRRLRNASKTSLGQYEYQLYGEMYAESGATAKYKFAGMYYSPDLGDYYTLNRFYNPTLARWTTRDPLGMVDGPNVYAYVGGDPSVSIDPLGAESDYTSPRFQVVGRVYCMMLIVWRALSATGGWRKADRLSQHGQGCAVDIRPLGGRGHIDNAETQCSVLCAAAKCGFTVGFFHKGTDWHYHLDIRGLIPECPPLCVNGREQGPRFAQNRIQSDDSVSGCSCVN